ncbi:unnamed protein product [Lactuca saligna]|uniref:Uncharacterized protein n=1 Tax=Lactuca saligna TaxID=75948 RepID=A0AA35YBL3_LACSI|nr:unnamed protein product [Lactuca saligna]
MPAKLVACGDDGGGLEATMTDWRRWRQLLAGDEIRDPNPDDLSTRNFSAPLGPKHHLPFFAGDLRNPLNSTGFVCGRAFFSHSALNKPKQPQTRSDLCNSTAGDVNTPNLRRLKKEFEQKGKNMRLSAWSG